MILEEILDVLKGRYKLSDLMDKTLSEADRVELIVKLETIAEIEAIIKGD